jgi:hypothetical protein
MMTLEDTAMASIRGLTIELLKSSRAGACDLAKVVVANPWRRIAEIYRVGK